MKQLILALLVTAAPTVFATEVCDPCKKPELKPKVVTVVKKEYVKAPCCEKGNTTTATADAAAGASAMTGNQTVTINIPPAVTKPEVKIVKVTKIKTKVRTVKVKTNVYVYKLNRLQLLLGQSKTKLQVDEDDCKCSLKASRKYEEDIGLQYLRDFDGFTGSITGTKNKNWYIGVGFNW